MTANNSKALSSTLHVLQPLSEASLTPLALFLHAVIQSSFLLSWGRRLAVCGSDSTEFEAPPYIEHWSAEKKAGYQQVLCRRMVSVCEEMHRCKRAETEVKQRGRKKTLIIACFKHFCVSFCWTTSKPALVNTSNVFTKRPLCLFFKYWNVIHTFGCTLRFVHKWKVRYKYNRLLLLLLFLLSLAQYMHLPYRIKS